MVFRRWIGGIESGTMVPYKVRRAPITRGGETVTVQATRRNHSDRKRAEPVNQEKTGSYLHGRIRLLIYIRKHS